jgi:hypothetical protein
MTAPTVCLWLFGWLIVGVALGWLADRLERAGRLAAIRAERRERGGGG